MQLLMSVHDKRLICTPNNSDENRYKAYFFSMKLSKFFSQKND